jgi:phenylalanine-4-hydroxylase
MPDFRFEQNDELAERQYVIDQQHDSLSEEDHQIWRDLYRRQERILVGRAADEWYDGMRALRIGADGIPDLAVVSDLLQAASGWRLVAVPGLVPDDVFFTHLASRRFPVTRWIRTREQLDYIVEPDIFHDCYGHVPHLADPFFADYLEHFGKMGLWAMEQGVLHNIARLYWYTVEFGLISTPKGLRIYGAGIASSKGESVYCLESQGSRRVKFDLERVMRSNYIIHTYQATYYVIDSYETLLKQTSGESCQRMIAQIQAEPGDHDPWDSVAGDQAVQPNDPIDPRLLAYCESVADPPTSYGD